MTALMIAAQTQSSRRQPIVEMLTMKKGIDINAKNNKGITTLMIAARSNSTSIVDTLIKKAGIDVNAKDG